MNYYAGIDGGSTYIKAALIDEDSAIVGTVVGSTGIDNSGNAEKMLQTLTQRARISRDDIRYITATGYSRKVLEVADDDVSEITAHAYGVRLTAPPHTKPGLVIDIGGQDSKLIYLDPQGRVKNFTMNDKCAAGTGKFLEVMAEMLETTIEQIGPESLESAVPCDINSMCVIFAQSEVVSLVARKFDRKDILSGVHASMAKRIGKMIRKPEISGDIIMTGGGALNVGLHKSFEEELMADIHVANHPQFNGSLGAALISKERAEKANVKRIG
jgi:predicted CoA-substrate-specific enzyme activase